MDYPGPIPSALYATTDAYFEFLVQYGLTARVEPHLKHQLASYCQTHFDADRASLASEQPSTQAQQQPYVQSPAASQVTNLSDIPTHKLPSHHARVAPSLLRKKMDDPELWAQFQEWQQQNIKEPLPHAQSPASSTRLFSSTNPFATSSPTNAAGLSDQTQMRMQGLGHQLLQTPLSARAQRAHPHTTAKVPATAIPGGWNSQDPFGVPSTPSPIGRQPQVHANPVIVPVSPFDLTASPTPAPVQTSQRADLFNVRSSGQQQQQQQDRQQDQDSQRQQGQHGMHDDEARERQYKYLTYLQGRHQVLLSELVTVQAALSSASLDYLHEYEEEDPSEDPNVGDKEGGDGGGGGGSPNGGDQGGLPFRPQGFSQEAMHFSAPASRAFGKRGYKKRGLGGRGERSL